MFKTVLVVLLVAIISLACANQYGVYLETPDEFYDYIKGHPGISWRELDKRSPLRWNRDGTGDFNEILNGLIEDGRIRVEGKNGPNTGNYFAIVE